MSAYAIVMLICSVNLSHSECQPDTALDLVRGPRVENVMQCAAISQSMIAATAIAPREGEEYMKVMCVASAPKVRAAARVVSDE